MRDLAPEAFAQITFLRDSSLSLLSFLFMSSCCQLFPSHFISSSPHFVVYSYQVYSVRMVNESPAKDATINSSAVNNSHRLCLLVAEVVLRLDEKANFIRHFIHRFIPPILAASTTFKPGTQLTTSNKFFSTAYIERGGSLHLY